MEITMVDLRRAPNRDLDLRFEIDHARQTIAVRATGLEGKPAMGELDLGAIRQLMARLVSVAKRIKALQIACFLAFFGTIFLVIYVCVLSHA
jgi:hypothetical protein